MKLTNQSFSVQLESTCSGAWAEIGFDVGGQWIDVARTSTTHLEKTKRNGQPIGGMPGDINEKPERFELTPDGAELIALARLFAAAPRLRDALEMARNGLVWRRDNQPGTWNGADDEALAEIDEILAEFEEE